MPSILSSFLYLLLKLAPGPFMILIKWRQNVVYQFLLNDLTIFDTLSGHLQKTKNHELIIVVL